MLIDAAISGYRNLMKKDAEMILEYKDLTIQLMWNVKTKLIIGANGNIKIIQKMPEQHNWKVRLHGTIDNSCTGHCAHTADRTNVRV